MSIKLLVERSCDLIHAAAATTDATDAVTVAYINQGCALRWAGIGTVIGICLTFAAGISLMFVCHKRLKCFCKALNNETSSSKAAYGANRRPSASSYRICGTRIS